MDRVDCKKRTSYINDLVRKIKENVYIKLDNKENLGDVLDEDIRNKTIQDKTVMSLIREEILHTSDEYFLSLPEKDLIGKRVFFDIRGMGLLDEFLEDDSVSEIMVNGLDPIFIEKRGHLINTGLSFGTTLELEDISQRIASRVNRVVNVRKPILDARLEDGSRVNVILEPVAINGPIITIRKFLKQGISLDDFVKSGTLSKEAAEYLIDAIATKKSIFISGGTGSGKTTLLNALSEFISPGERVITIEDSAELRLKGLPNLVRLEARQENMDGNNAITIRDLLKASLRMRPDRIIVGEVRGEEVVDMLQAMNTGHDGSLSTGHANSGKDMLTRLEMMALMGADFPPTVIKSQIASAIDIIVHLERMKNGKRRVVEISKVVGLDGEGVSLEKVFVFNEETGKGELIRCS